MNVLLAGLCSDGSGDGGGAGCCGREGQLSRCAVQGPLHVRMEVARRSQFASGEDDTREIEDSSAQVDPATQDMRTHYWEDTLKQPRRDPAFRRLSSANQVNYDVHRPQLSPISSRARSSAIMRCRQIPTPRSGPILATPRAAIFANSERLPELDRFRMRDVHGLFP